MEDPKQHSGIDRREFCKTIPGFALGSMTASLVFGHSKYGGSANDNQEDNVAGRITAIQLKVISQKGHCDAGQKVGDVVTITESGVEGKVCIHALYSVLPKVFAMMYEAKFPWLENPDISTHACPDAYNPVVFEVIRIREK